VAAGQREATQRCCAEQLRLRITRSIRACHIIRASYIFILL
jgi:hypothetical protein